jgi:hypothetical protein
MLLPEQYPASYQSLMSYNNAINQSSASLSSSQELPKEAAK